MQIVNAERIDALTPYTRNIKTTMLPWNTANTHQLPNTATADQVIEKLKQFSTDIKATQAWYKGTALPALRI